MIDAKKSYYYAREVSCQYSPFFREKEPWPEVGGGLNFGKAIGPDMIPNRVLKDFAPELGPLIMDIYNCSLREGYVPDLLKRSIINPPPKVSPPQEIQSDLRPNASDMHPCQSHGRVCAQQVRSASFGKT